MPKKTPKKKTTVASEKKSVAAKKPVRRPLIAEESLPRRLRPRRYDSFRLQKRIPSPFPPVAGSFTLLFRAIGFLCSQIKLFGGILFVYIILEIVLVQGLSLIASGGTLASTRQLLSGAANIASTSTSLFLLLIGNGTGNTSSSAYQFVLLLIISLVLIWAVRQSYAGIKIRIRDGFYNGIAPLVPFVLVLMVIGLELAPSAVGVILYTAVNVNGIASSGLERFLWGIVASIFICVTIYMLLSSIFALYIVTLQGMTPVVALRKAGDLVKNRRLMLLRKVLFLPCAIIIIMAVLIVPFLLANATVSIAPTILFVVTAAMIALLHTYMYMLYRELLNE
jgi:hypothetical protein